MFKIVNKALIDVTTKVHKISALVRLSFSLV